jgi:hypothetical protein
VAFALFICAASIDLHMYATMNINNGKQPLYGASTNFVFPLLCALVLAHFLPQVLLQPCFIPYSHWTQNSLSGFVEISTVQCYGPTYPASFECIEMVRHTALRQPCVAILVMFRVSIGLLTPSVS